MIVMDADYYKRQRFFELLARKKSGDISLEEQRELAVICMNDAQLAGIAESMNAFFKTEIVVSTKPDERHVLKKWGEFEQKIVPQVRFDSYSKSGKIFRLIRYWAVAAAVIAVIVAAHIFSRNNRTTTVVNSPNIVTTNKGSRSNLVLPDGTQVWLNADSRISYTGDFIKNRVLKLSGEAYFDVVHDKLHPFIVQTRDMEVKVLGTVFNIRAYDSEVSSQATLMKGVIEVSLKQKSGEKITLRPNEKLVVMHEIKEGIRTIQKDSTMPEIAIFKVKPTIGDTLANEVLWVHNKLVFDQKKLSEIIIELERWYNLKIIVKDSSLLNRSLTGIYEDESIIEVLESFKLAAGFNYTIKNNQVEIFK